MMPNSSPLDYTTAHVWMADNYSVPFAVLVAYAVHILLLNKIMTGRKNAPHFVRGLKAIWDLTLAIGSLIGAIVLVPFLWTEIVDRGIFLEICSSSAQSTNPVLYIFMWSKFFELFDTTLIILGKKKLIFLHWYHHMATLLYCWDAYISCNTSGALFTGMNLCVHTIMYSYYALTYFGRLPNVLRAFITGLQILQMVAGMAITVAHIQCENASDAQAGNSKWALAMYFSFFLLFGKLFFDSYISTRATDIREKVH